MASLHTPELVQAWLFALPYNWELDGPTARTLRGVLRHQTAHCLEAALSAAAILETHGHPPLVMDIESTDGLDHVVYLFQGPDRAWGAIGRSRCSGLHGRKPVYDSPADLARSYQLPFIDTTGRVKGFGILDLRTLPTARWRHFTGNVFHVEQALRDHRHHRLPTPPALYKEWKGRFDQWWQGAGKPEHAWPDSSFYPGHETWWSPPRAQSSRHRSQPSEPGRRSDPAKPRRDPPR